MKSRRVLLGILAVLATLLAVGAAGAAGTFSYDPPAESFSYDPPAESGTVNYDPPQVCIDPAPYTTADGDTLDLGRRCVDPDPVSVPYTHDPAPRQVTYDPAPRDVTCPDDVCPPATAPPPPPPPPGADGIAFPRSAQYISFSYNADAMSHFQLNVGRGCNPGALDDSYAANPHQVNFIIPGKLISPDGRATAPGCGTGGTDFATSYGGYSTLSSAIASPYPGIGSIRAYDNSACPGGDEACFTDNARMPQNLDWSNNATPDWAAKVRAHFYQAQLATGAHPGISGVFGDNFVWWAPYFKNLKSAGGAGPEGTGTAWDDGSVENITKLHELIPDALIGSNGGGISCAFGNTYVGSVAGKECSGAGDTALWEGYGGDLYTKTPSRMDSAVAGFQSWLTTPADDGHPKRCVVNVYGTFNGSNKLGRVPTVQDQRRILAYATVSGCYLWVVNGDNWTKSAIPGTASGDNFAIPEMGDTAAYPRGWLGLPTDDPVKVASGEWKRSFSGGTVYVNATTSAWNIDGHTVPAQDGLFVKS